MGVTALARFPPATPALAMVEGFSVSAQQRKSCQRWLKQEQGGDSMKRHMKHTGNHESKYFEAHTQLASGTHHHKMPLRPRV